MSLQERYTHYDCLLPLAFQFVSGMFKERATLHGIFFNMYEYNINQADN